MIGCADGCGYCDGEQRVAWLFGDSVGRQVWLQFRHRILMVEAMEEVRLVLEEAGWLSSLWLVWRGLVVACLGCQSVGHSRLVLWGCRSAPSEVRQWDPWLAV
jgi:hypothetical protein